MRLPQHAENPLHITPAVEITVGQSDADLIGFDNRALQAAVDYVGALGGGTVYIGPGTYILRDSLHLRSRVRVCGAGPDTVLKKDREWRSDLKADGDFGEAAITVADPNGFAIGGGVYVSSRTMCGFLGACATLLNTDGMGYFTLSRTLNADLLVREDAFATTVFPVISGYDLEDAVVENLTIDGSRTENPTRIDGCRTAGIFLYRGDGCTIRNCTVRDYNGDGIGFQQSNDVTVEHCIIENCGGLGLHPGSGSQRPHIAHCRAIGNTSDGIFFCWRVRHGTAENNHLESNGGWGISLGHKDTDNLLRGNTIVGNKSGGIVWRNEDEPMAAHRNTVENNTIQNNVGSALFINGVTDGTVIRGNTIEGEVGLQIGERARAVTLENNTITAERDVLDERAK